MQSYKQKKCRISASCLNQWAMDFENNKKNIIKSIEECQRQKSRLRMCGELEVTGYSCEDHFLEPDTVEHSWEVLADILKQEFKDILIFIGMPVMFKNILYNCVIVILNQKIILIRPKLQMADDGLYREGRYFQPYSLQEGLQEFVLPEIIFQINNQEKTIFGQAILLLNDTSVGIESCEELWQPLSQNIQLFTQGCEIVLNNSASHFEYQKMKIRKEMMTESTQKIGGIYLYDNLRGCDGGRMYFDGGCMIIQNGELIKLGQTFSMQDVEVVTCEVDLQAVRTKRISKRYKQSENKIQEVRVDFNLISNPVIEEQTQQYLIEVNKPIEEVGYSTSCYLWDYLRKSGAAGFFLPLSGGADSSATALIVFQMCVSLFNYIQSGQFFILDQLRNVIRNPQFSPSSPQDICNQLFYTSYLATKNSSKMTESYSQQLAKDINSFHQSINIQKVVDVIHQQINEQFKTQIQFKLNDGSYQQDLALQNLQSRLRMVYSYLISQLLSDRQCLNNIKNIKSDNKTGFILVLGSSNLDEGLRGYMTKYDCSSADINLIGSFNKKDLKEYLEYTYDKFKFESINNIIKQQPTAELTPLDDSGQVQQNDEQDMGMTYEELSIFGYLRKVAKQGPVSMFNYLSLQWNKLQTNEIAQKVKNFYKFYSINRHKQNVATPSMHAKSYNTDDNRFDLRPIIINPNWNHQFQVIEAIINSNLKKNKT